MWTGTKITQHTTCLAIALSKKNARLLHGSIVCALIRECNWCSLHYTEATLCEGYTLLMFFVLLLFSYTETTRTPGDVKEVHDVRER